jgi:ethanolamine utilization protein EutL
VSILEPIMPKVLSVRRIHAAHPSLRQSYGADPERHTSFGLVTCEQDDRAYVALEEATEHAEGDVLFAKSF